MKAAASPLQRVEPELREAAEAVLEAGASPSSLIETSMREAIERRSGRYVAAGVVLADLGARRAKARPPVGV